MTMQLIQRVELSSDTATIDFTSIPQTFTDLQLYLSLRTTRVSPEDTVKFVFNGITSSYAGRWLRGDDINGTASGTLSNSTLVLYQNTDGLTANTFSNAQVYLPSYTSANLKSISIDTVQGNNGGAWRALITAQWTNTAAINSISLSPNVGPNFKAGSSATLYGILSGSSGGVTVS